jgi:heat shock protein HslJ
LFSLLLLQVYSSFWAFADKSSNVPPGTTPLDVSYKIGQDWFQLSNGIASEPVAPGSASRVITRVVGDPVAVDLDADGDEDAVLILSQSPGGSGTFFYLAGALRKDNGYYGTPAVFLGDRISPEQLLADGQRIVVRYKTRASGESFATPTTIAQERVFVLNKKSGHLAQIDPEFSHEADPKTMTLNMKTWTWVHTIYNNDTRLTPSNPSAFTMMFMNDKTMAFTTDCNDLRGSYSLDDRKIQFGSMTATRKYCDGSQEQAFTKMLGSIGSYFFTAKGQLVMELKYDSGSAIFR